MQNIDSNSRVLIVKKNKEDLSIQELKTYPGLEQLTDEQAVSIIASLKELSILLYYASRRQENKIAA